MKIIDETGSLSKTFSEIRPGVIFSWGMRSVWHVKINDTQTIALSSNAISAYSPNEILENYMEAREVIIR